MKGAGAFFYLVVAGLLGGHGTASPSPVGDGDAIRDSENFRMGILHNRATATNLQSFAGSLGVKASAITDSGDPQRPFEVDGDTFTDFATAAIRACDNQFNTCADIANNKTGSFAVSDCDKQNTQCKSSQQQAQVKTFPPPALFSSNADFDFFCDS